MSGEPPGFRLSDARPLVQVSATEAPGESDWFDLGITLSIDGEEVPFQSLFAAIALGETHLILDSGIYFSIERPEYDQLRRLIDEAKSLQDKESDGLRLSTYQAGLWADLAQLGVVEQQSERWARTVKGLLELDSIPQPELPVGLVAELRPYQREGFSWLSFLRSQGLGGILADDMGLGKTLQALALIGRAVELEPSAAPVPGRGADQRRTQLGSRGRTLHARAGRGVHRRDGASRGDQPGRPHRRGPGRGHVVRLAADRLRGLRGAAVERPDPRRGAVRQELPGEDVPVRAAAQRTVQAGDHRYAAGEQPDGPLVVALDRGAGVVPEPAAVHGVLPQADREGDGPRAARNAATSDQAVDAATYQGAGGDRAAAQAGAGPRGDPAPATPQDLPDPPAAGAAEGARPDRRHGQEPVRDLPLAHAASPAQPGPDPGRREVLRGALEQGRRVHRAGHRGGAGGSPGLGVQPVHQLPAAWFASDSTSRGSATATSTGGRATGPPRSRPSRPALRRSS